MHSFKILVFLSIFLLISCSYNQATLRVHGSSLSSVKPDKVTIKFGISTLQPTAHESLEENNRIISKAISALTKINLSTDEIGTSNFNLAPSYEHIYHRNNQSSTSFFKGYEVKLTLIIKTNKLDLAGTFIDTAVSSGIKNIESVNFEISPSILQGIQDELTELAVKNAKTKAELALRPLNGKILGIKSVEMNDESRYHPVHLAYAKSAAFANDATPERTEVYAQSKDIKVGVDIEFYVISE